VNLKSWNDLAAILDPEAFSPPGNELTVEWAERRNAAREKVRQLENALVASGWLTDLDAARARRQAISECAEIADREAAACRRIDHEDEADVADSIWRRITALLTRSEEARGGDGERV
jgi:hypothetical protein